MKDSVFEENYIGRACDSMDGKIHKLFIDSDIMFCFLFAGHSFFKKHISSIEDALSVGKKINLLIARPGSEIISDTLAIEDFYGFSTAGKDNDIELEIAEVNNIILDLNTRGYAGTVELRFFRMLYRLPFIIGTRNTAGKPSYIRSITNIVIPPGRTKDSLMIETVATGNDIQQYLIGRRNGTSFDISNLAINLFALFEYIWNKEEILNDVL